MIPADRCGEGLISLRRMRDPQAMAIMPASFVNFSAMRSAIAQSDACLLGCRRQDMACVEVWNTVCIPIDKLLGGFQELNGSPQPNQGGLGSGLANFDKSPRIRHPYSGAFRGRGLGFRGMVPLGGPCSLNPSSPRMGPSPGLPYRRAVGCWKRRLESASAPLLEVASSPPWSEEEPGRQGEAFMRTDTDSHITDTLKRTGGAPSMPRRGNALPVAITANYKPTS